MKVTLKNKVYDLTFDSQVGVYYRYEVQWGSSFGDDNALLGGNVSIMRLTYAILQNSNKGLEVTFDDFVSEINDDQYLDICEWIKGRFEYFAQEKADGATRRATQDGAKDGANDGAKDGANDGSDGMEGEEKNS